MLEVRAALNMVLGVCQNLTNNPSLDALAAYLFTTCAVVMVPAILASIVMQKDYSSPAFGWWGKWFVRVPFVALAAIVLYLVHYPARAIEGAANRHWTAEHMLGHILASGANFAAGCFYWPARGIAELTGLGIANPPRGTRATAPASAHH